MSDWTPMLVLAGIVWCITYILYGIDLAIIVMIATGLPAIGLAIEIYFAPLMDDQ